MKPLPTQSPEPETRLPVPGDLMEKAMDLTCARFPNFDIRAAESVEYFNETFDFYLGLLVQGRQLSGTPGKFQLVPRAK